MKSFITLVSSTLLLSTLSACHAGPTLMMPMAPMMPAPLMQMQATSRVIYHVVPESKAKVWHVKQQKNPQAMATFTTKAEAIAAGRAMARSHALGQLIVHKANGQIETEYTYGQDPKDIAG